MLTPNIELDLNLANDQRPKTNDGVVGGADRDRTGGLLVANQALSQLSYSPIELLAFSC